MPRREEAAQPGTPATHTEKVPDNYRSHIPQIDRNGYLSPSGSYMMCGYFKVSGKNSETGRQNTKRIYAVDQSAAIEYARQMGLCDPLCAEVLQFDPPSERQIEYMKNVNAPIPEGITSLDASAILTRFEDHDWSVPADGIVQFARDHHIAFSQFASADTLARMLCFDLKGWEKYEWIVYAIYCKHTHEALSNPDSHARQADFVRAAKEIEQNPDLVKIFDNISAETVAKMRFDKRTKAYQETCRLLDLTL